MEAITEHLFPGSVPSLPVAMGELFGVFGVEECYEIIVFHLFSAWACLPDDRKKIDEKKLALFCDQLIRLVAAADQLHQTGRVNVDLEKGVRGG